MKPVSLFLTFPTLGFLCACGGILATPPAEQESPRDAEADATTASVSPPAPDASSDTPDAPETSETPVLSAGYPDGAQPNLPPAPPLPFDGGPSPCVAGGGKCVELVPCDGVAVSLDCGWSAECCMPIGADAGQCPASIPVEGSPCDVPPPPTLYCSYPPCTPAMCTDGKWAIGPTCSPPPSP